jgi:hypothetical protein
MLTARARRRTPGGCVVDGLPGAPLARGQWPAQRLSRRIDSARRTELSRRSSAERPSTASGTGSRRLSPRLRTDGPVYSWGDFAVLARTRRVLNNIKPLLSKAGVRPSRPVAARCLAATDAACSGATVFERRLGQRGPAAQGQRGARPHGSGPSGAQARCAAAADSGPGGVPEAAQRRCRRRSAAHLQHAKARHQRGAALSARQRRRGAWRRRPAQETLGIVKETAQMRSCSVLAAYACSVAAALVFPSRVHTGGSRRVRICGSSPGRGITAK